MFGRKALLALALVPALTGNTRLLAQAPPPTAPPTVSVSAQFIAALDAQYETAVVDVVSLLPKQTKARTLTLEIRSNLPYWGSNGGNHIVRSNIVLQTPRQPERVVLTYPGSFAQYLQLDCYEDGNLVFRSSMPGTGLPDARFVSDVPTVLFVGAAAENAQAWGAALGHYQSITQARAQRGARTRFNGTYSFRDPQGNTWAAQPPALFPWLREDLFDEWVAYFPVDMVFISLEDLRWLAGQSWTRLHALAHWTAAGGNLVVFETEVDDGQAEIDQLLPPVMNSATLVDQAWYAPDAEDFDVVLKDFEYDDPASPNFYPNQGSHRLRNPQLELDNPPSEAPFRFRSHGLGAIVALDESGFAEDVATNAWLLNTLTPARWLAAGRLGFRPTEGSRDFWNLLVPNTGRTPVVAFQVLITLFAVAIGPLNFVLLKRRKRLTLLVVTVPLLALAATAGIFAYALASDGLSVRLRTRSYTEIDYRTGTATCWARLSYYAGLAPSSGLSFSRDVAVVPLESMGADERGAPERSIEIGQRQHFARNWLPSREPVQFVTVRSRTTSAGLQVAQLDPSAPPRVKNNLGVAIRPLLVVDDAGQAYWAQSLAPHAAATLEPIGLSEALQRFSILSGENVPANPDDLLDGNSGFFGFRRQRYYFGSQKQIPGAPVSFDGGRLEQGLRWMTNRAAWIDAQGAARPQVRRTWLAVADGSPELEPGLAGAQREDCFDVIRGLW